MRSFRIQTNNNKNQLLVFILVMKQARYWSQWDIQLNTSDYVPIVNEIYKLL